MVMGNSVSMYSNLFLHVLMWVTAFLCILIFFARLDVGNSVSMYSNLFARLDVGNSVSMYSNLFCTS
jgi:hypothetical protein